MKEKCQLLKTSMFLLSNGNIPVWTNQEIYELAWDQGIRPLNERKLKPILGQRRGMSS